MGRPGSALPERSHRAYQGEVDAFFYSHGYVAVLIVDYLSAELGTEPLAAWSSWPRCVHVNEYSPTISQTTAMHDAPSAILFVAFMVLRSS